MVSENTTNGCIAGIGTLPAALYAFFIEPANIAIIASIVLPVIFFVLGQIINVCLRIYLAKREKE